MSPLVSLSAERRAEVFAEVAAISRPSRSFCLPVVGSALGRQMARRVPGARTTVARIRRTGRRMLVEAEVVASRALTRADVDAVAAILRRFVHPGLDLAVRSRVGADFSAP